MSAMMTSSQRTRALQAYVHIGRCAFHLHAVDNVQHSRQILIHHVPCSSPGIADHQNSETKISSRTILLPKEESFSGYELK